MNKYKNIVPEVLSIPEVGADRQIDQYGFAGGLHAEKVPQQLALDETTDLNDVRFAEGTVYKDFGFNDPSSSTAPGVIFALGVTGVTGTEIFYRLFFNGSAPNWELDIQYSSDLITWTDNVTAAPVVATRKYPSVATVIDRMIMTFNGLSAPQSWLGAGVGGLSGSPPAADYVAAFGDRALLMSGTSISWPISGSVTDWTGVGSGTVTLIDGHDGLTDKITGGHQVGHNVFALFRERSIWKAFKTGNVSQAIGFTPWIDGIGTFYSESIVSVGRGAAFLGTDYMIYILSANELIPIGKPIEKKIREILVQTYSPNQGVVFGSFDHTNSELRFWFPNTGINYCINLQEFFTTQKLAWRKETIAHSVAAKEWRLPGAFFSNASTSYIKAIPPGSPVTTKAGASFTGHIWSRPLNAGRELATLSLLTFYYTSPSASSLTLKTTADGGLTTKETKSNVTVPAASIGGVITIALNTTGYDVRFKIEFDQTVDIRITGYHPTIIHRGSVEYD